MTFLPFWHSKFSFIAYSLLLPHRKAHEKNTEIGWKSAENRPLAVKIAIIPCTLSPSAGCSTESDLQRSPRHQRYPPFWQSGVPLLHDYLWLWLFIYWFRDWLIDLAFFFIFKCLNKKKFIFIIFIIFIATISKLIIIIFIFIDYCYWFIDLSISLLPFLLKFIILYCRIFQKKGIICRHFDNPNRVSLYTKCHRNQPKFEEKRTNSVEIVASDSLSPSWWCFKRFSTTNASLKSRLRHRICQKNSRKCVNFLQFYILNKILHANHGYKF